MSLGTFESTADAPNGLRDKVVLYPKSKFLNDPRFVVDMVVAIKKEVEKEIYSTNSIGVGMCGNSYEIIKPPTIDSDVVCVVDTHVMGIVKRSIPKWAIEKIVTLAKNPEYFI